MGFWKTYRSLNAEQRRVLKSKHLTANRPIDAVISFLQPIAACDRVGDKMRTRLGCTGGILILLSIVGFIVAANANEDSGRSAWVLLSTLVAVIAIALVGAWSWTKGIDVSNNLRQFMLPVLSVFREDIDPKRKVQLRLDLGLPTAKQKLQQKNEPYSRGVYYKIIESFYLDPWASAEMPLTDGSVLKWSIVDHIRERSQTKKNPRGKIKTKVKYTVKTSVDVELTLRSDAYNLAGAEGERVKAGGKKKAVRIKARHKRQTLDPIDPVVFIDMVAGIYRRATPVQ